MSGNSEVGGVQEQYGDKLPITPLNRPGWVHLGTRYQLEWIFHRSQNYFYKPLVLLGLWKLNVYSNMT